MLGINYFNVRSLKRATKTVKTVFVYSSREWDERDNKPVFRGTDQILFSLKEMYLSENGVVLDHRGQQHESFLRRRLKLLAKIEGTTTGVLVPLLNKHTYVYAGSGD